MNPLHAPIPMRRGALGLTFVHTWELRPLDSVPDHWLVRYSHVDTGETSTLAQYVREAVPAAHWSLEVVCRDPNLRQGA